MPQLDFADVQDLNFCSVWAHYFRSRATAAWGSCAKQHWEWNPSPQPTGQHLPNSSLSWGCQAVGPTDEAAAPPMLSEGWPQPGQRLPNAVSLTIIFITSYRPRPMQQVNTPTTSRSLKLRHFGGDKDFNKRRWHLLFENNFICLPSCFSRRLQFWPAISHDSKAGDQSFSLTPDTVPSRELGTALRFRFPPEAALQIVTLKAAWAWM